MNLATNTALVVAITDLLIAVEAGWFAILLYRSSRSTQRMLIVLLFALLGVSALLGAVFHAFFPLKEVTPLGWVVWIATASSTGLIAVVLWILSGLLVFGKRALYIVGAGATMLFVGFVWWLTNVNFHFSTVIYFYAPALLVFTAVVLYRYSKHQKGWGMVGAGLVASIVAAGLQASTLSIGIFDHNALYHLLQGVALLLLYRGFHCV